MFDGILCDRFNFFLFGYQWGGGRSNSYKCCRYLLTFLALTFAPILLFLLATVGVFIISLGWRNEYGEPTSKPWDSYSEQYFFCCRVRVEPCKGGILIAILHWAIVFPILMVLITIVIGLAIIPYYLFILFFVGKITVRWCCKSKKVQVLEVDGPKRRLNEPLLHRSPYSSYDDDEYFSRRWDPVPLV